MVFSDWLGSLSQTALLGSSTSFKPGTELLVPCMRFKAYATQVWDSESRIAFALPQPKTPERRRYPERDRLLRPQGRILLASSVGRLPALFGRVGAQFVVAIGRWP